jgi:hypothetical protein
MNEMPVFRCGDRVLIKCGGRDTPAQVFLASSHGRALALFFDAIIEGFAGSMPVLWDAEAATFRSIIGGIAIGLVKDEQRQ